MKKIFIYLTLILILLSSVFSSNCFAGEDGGNNVIDNSFESKITNVNDLPITSNCILLMEKETGDIIYEKNGYQKMFPASTTKILTAILVLENCDLNDIATVSSNAVKSVPKTYTTCALQVGEQMRIEDLLHCLLIPSANDAANVLAEHISGSVAEFSNLMNAKAKEIGCTGSNFANPSGIHDENLYSTAHDLALLARYALNFDTFRNIITTTTYTLPSTEAYPNSDRTVNHTNLILNPNYKNYYYEYATGVKTGYTDPARDCLVASAKKDDVEFIIATLGNGTNPDGLREKYVDCKTLFDFAFDNYTTHYKNLQLEKEKRASLKPSLIIEDLKNLDDNTLKTISKVVAIIVILLALKIIFGKRKKKNHYKYTGKRKRRKPKH